MTKLNQNNKEALVICSCDGIACMYSGVGVVVSFFLEAVKDNRFKELIDGIDLFVVTTHITKKNKEYEPKRLSKIQKMCQEFGGDIFLLKTLVSGDNLDEIWAGNKTVSYEEQWISCSSQLGAYVNNLHNKNAYDKTTVIAHDTLFAHTSKYIKNENIQICWIPHCLSSLVQDRFSKKRFSFEDEGITSIIKRNDKVGFISNQTKSLLMQKHDVKKKSLISFYSGIYSNSEKYKLEQNSVDVLKKNNIPTNKNLIFTWGRCVSQKGIDLILEGLSKYFSKVPEDADNYHLVLLCPTLNTPLEYHNLINNLLKKLQCSFTFIDAFHKNLAFHLLKYDFTRLLILGSRFEGFGLTSIEASIFGNKNMKIIYSPIPTFHEVFERNSQAYMSQSHSSEGYEDAILNTLNSKNGTISINTQKTQSLNFVENQSKGLRQLIKKL